MINKSRFIALGNWQDRAIFIEKETYDFYSCPLDKETKLDIRWTILPTNIFLSSLAGQIGVFQGRIHTRICLLLISFVCLTVCLGWLLKNKYINRKLIKTTNFSQKELMDYINKEMSDVRRLIDGGIFILIAEILFLSQYIYEGEFKFFIGCLLSYVGTYILLIKGDVYRRYRVLKHFKDR